MTNTMTGETTTLAEEYDFRTAQVAIVEFFATQAQTDESRRHATVFVDNVPWPKDHTLILRSGDEAPPITSLNITEAVSNGEHPLIFETLYKRGHVQINGCKHSNIFGQANRMTEELDSDVIFAQYRAYDATSLAALQAQYGRLMGGSS
jgi:hypothetical protein